MGWGGKNKKKYDKITHKSDGIWTMCAKRSGKKRSE